MQARAFAQADSTASSPAASWNNLATGHSYWGIDLGLTGSAYIGSQNFLWSISTPNAFLGTYEPFNSLGTGIGFVGGMKAGFEVTPSFDIEAKLRFMTYHTSNQETSPSIILDPYHPTTPAPPSSPGTSIYSLTLSSLDVAILGHFRLSDQFYAIGGFSASTLTGNSFSASQQVDQSYLRQNTHTIANVSEQGSGDSSLVNWFTGVRGDVQIGAGSVFRLGASTMLMDVELLAGIPLTGWLTKVADSSLSATASYWLQPTSITDPHLWYATLTVGLRFPFHDIPPPPQPEPTPPIPPTPASAMASPSQPVATDSGVVLSGHVTDANTGQPVSADLTAVDLSNNQIFAKSHSDSSGNYAVRVKGQGKYSVTANAPDHLFGTAYFEVDSEGRILKSHSDISLGGLKGGKTRMLIFFDFDKADLQPASTPELNQALALLQTVSTLNVEIAGYSDSLGALQHNRDLSLRRAKAVRDYLIRHGIASERISATGYGPMPPIAPNNTDEGRAENRRVEFVVKEK